MLSNVFEVNIISSFLSPQKKTIIDLVHNTMVTSAIFAPNPVVIMDHLYSSNLPISTENLSVTNRSTHPPNLPRSIPITPIGNNTNRTRLICVHSAPSPLESSLASNNTNGSVYVMVTADSKGQLKLLVNRYHR